MGKSIRVTALASVIGVVLAGGMVSAPVATAQSVTTVAATESYIITFNEPGLLHYSGGAGSLEATAPEARGQRRLDAKSPAAVAYSNYLQQERASHVQSISSALGRAVTPTHQYGVTKNGVAAELTAAEANTVRNLPGVQSVRAAGVYHQDTFRGPTFIGADTVWSGANVPGGTGTRGFGKTLGSVDGGTNADHPSFANDASCGFSAGNPKLKSAVDCSTTDGGGACNGPNPEDLSDGHGVHTASTAAGNVVTTSATPAPVFPAPYTSMTGVAPCASIRAYKVCETSTCSGAAIEAGLENTIVDDVDVVNYSISGGRDPWNDADRIFLDMVNADIVVAASAGNTRTETPVPIGQVNHLGPWTMTVAASTHDAAVLAFSSLTGPGTPPSAGVGVRMNRGSTTPTGSLLPPTTPIKSFPANLEACTAGTAIPAGYFANSIAFVRRGTCSFAEKITNAVNGGAILVLVGNNQIGPISMNTTGAPTTVPSYSMTQAPGDAIRDFLAANPTATADFNPDGRLGDVLADFSLRGPVPAAFAGVTKPDITGPGVDIYAAKNAANGEYGYLSGTSMSSPHLAGAALLVRAAKPAWTPMEVKAALQLTAKPDGFDDNGSTPWDVDDVGNGRVDMTKAIKTALTMNETYANFVAANPTGGSIDAKTLNIPSMRNTNCAPNCSFTRTVTSKSAAATTWTATFVGSRPSGNPTVTVTPANFTVAAGGTQALNVAVDLGYGSPVTAAEPAFGYVVLTPSDNTVPTVRMTLAVAGTRDGIFKDDFGSVPLCPSQLLLDPSFEATNPAGYTNPNWNSSSTSGGATGSSICDADCGADVARTGAFWTWFGGWGTGNETGTVSQAITLPAGPARWINFYLLRSATTSNAAMTVSIDGTVVQTFPGVTTTEPAYVLRSVPVPATYLNGASHTVEFKFTKTGAANMGNMHVDDITLDCSVGTRGATRPASPSIVEQMRRNAQ